MKLAVALVLALSSAPLLSSEPVAPLPERFIGDWGKSLADCGGDTDDMRLRIETDRLSFFESSGPLRSVDIHDDNEVAVIVELTGEGETWLLKTTLGLSADGDTLTLRGNAADTPVTRVRCDSILGLRSLEHMGGTLLAS